MTDKDVSMTTRVEVTKKYAQAYRDAAKKQKSQILDTVVEITGWNRDHARQQLTRRLQQAPGRAQATIAVLDQRRTKPRKYSYDALRVLQHIWAVAGGICGKYLHASMQDWITSLEAAGHLNDGHDHYSAAVREELLSMSPATIDRYLQPARARDPIRGKTTTKPSTLLRNSISIRKAGDEVEAEPGFFEVDTVAHCGPTTAGEFIRSVNFTDVYTGWVYTHAVRNNATTHILTAFNTAVAVVPYMITGIDCDNGSEFMNHRLIDWAAHRKVFFTRSRPYKKNDQATIESKNNHLVRRYGFYYRYDTPDELDVLTRLWSLVNDRLNFFTPTKKPTGYTTDSVGRRKRIYDSPRTPYQRLIDADVLSQKQQEDLAEDKASLDVAHIAGEIDRLQQRLVRLAAAKTRKLAAALDAKKALPDPAGIKIRKPSA